MNITITEDKKIIFEMKDQLIAAIELFQSWDGINIKEVATSPAQKKTC